MKMPSVSELRNCLLDKYGVIVMFLLIPVLLIVSFIHIETHWVILIPISLIILYDLLFRFSYKGKWAAHGRDYISTLEGIRAAMHYTAILLGFIGIVLSVLLAKDLPEEVYDKIIELFSESGLLRFYSASLVIIATLMLLFIPVTYTSEQKIQNTKKLENVEPSVALKNYYLLILLSQKILIILCLYFVFLMYNIYSEVGMDFLFLNQSTS